MRDVLRLTKTNPSGSKQADFDVTTVQIANPTGSKLYLRTTALDVPTAINADYTLYPQMVAHLPMMGRMIAAAFDNVSILGTPAFPDAQATFVLLSKDEIVGTIGSMQGGLARLQLYDRNPIMVAQNNIGFVHVGAGSGISWRYVVPANRMFQLVEGQFTIQIQTPQSKPDIIPSQTVSISTASGLDHVVSLFDSDIGATKVETWLPTNLIFPSGAINGNYNFAVTGGSNDAVYGYGIAMWGVEFDQ